MNKAGSILLSKDSKQVGLVFRRKKNDISFPKGHIEENESLIECAIRETEEETGIKCVPLVNKEIGIMKYSTKKEGNINLYMYLLKETGLTNEKIDEELLWVNIDEVDSRLTYDNLKDFWFQVKPLVIKIIESRK